MLTDATGKRKRLCSVAVQSAAAVQQGRSDQGGHEDTACLGFEGGQIAVKLILERREGDLHGAGTQRRPFIGRGQCRRVQGGEVPNWKRDGGSKAAAFKPLLRVTAALPVGPLQALPSVDRVWDAWIVF